MKLQFAFGNPRRKKGVARRRKSRKNKGVKSKSARATSGGLRSRRKAATALKLKKAVASMAKKRRSVRRKKNPEVHTYRKGKRIVGRSRVIATDREARDHLAAIHSVEKQMKDQAKTLTPTQRASLRKKWLNAKKELKKREEELKTQSRYREEGATVKTSHLGHKKKKSKKKKGVKAVARKRKSKKSKASRRRKSKKVAKAAAPKRSRRKSSKRKSRKGGRRKMSAAAKRAFVRRMKAARKAKGSGKKKGSGKRKSRKGSKRRRPRMISHRHSASTRHIKKGTSFRFKTVAKKGKRKITVSGRVKVNPYRRNPMQNLSAQSKKYLGIDAAELSALALGGLAVPLVNAGIGKIPGMNSVVAKINEFVGPQATGSVIPILAGIAFNVGGDYASGDSKKYLKMVGEGLAAAGIVSLVAGLSQRYVAPMIGLSGMGIMPSLSGINYTPGFRGINYTPTMRGMGDIRYTPNMNGMGVMPQLSGMGASPDFGSANYGGGGGSREARTQPADFGGDFSADSEMDQWQSEDDNMSSSMN